MHTLAFPHTPADAPYVGLLPGFSPDRYYQGFPSFRHLDFTFAKRYAGVQVFNFPSKGESIILTVKHKTVRRSTCLPGAFRGGSATEGCRRCSWF